VFRTGPIPVPLAIASDKGDGGAHDVLDAYVPVQDNPVWEGPSHAGLDKRVVG
jgi:hypothetical protein